MSSTTILPAVLGTRWCAASFGRASSAGFDVFRRQPCALEHLANAFCSARAFGGSRAPRHASMRTKADRELPPPNRSPARTRGRWGSATVCLMARVRRRRARPLVGRAEDHLILDDAPRLSALDPDFAIGFRFVGELLPSRSSRALLALALAFALRPPQRRRRPPPLVLVLALLPPSAPPPPPPPPPRRRPPPPRLLPRPPRTTPSMVAASRRAGHRRGAHESRRRRRPSYSFGPVDASGRRTTAFFCASAPSPACRAAHPHRRTPPAPPCSASAMEAIAPAPSMAPLMRPKARRRDWEL